MNSDSEGSSGMTSSLNSPVLASSSWYAAVTVFKVVSVTDDTSAARRVMVFRAHESTPLYASGMFIAFRASRLAFSSVMDFVRSSITFRSPSHISCNSAAATQALSSSFFIAANSTSDTALALTSLSSALVDSKSFLSISTTSALASRIASALIAAVFAASKSDFNFSFSAVIAATTRSASSIFLTNASCCLATSPSFAPEIADACLICASSDSTSAAHSIFISCNALSDVAWSVTMSTSRSSSSFFVIANACSLNASADLDNSNCRRSSSLTPSSSSVSSSSVTLSARMAVMSCSRVDQFAPLIAFSMSSISSGDNAENTSII
mmetsp:Transcript_6694/g.24378  ORF Transcript_6694/g.24378 Transcript_6694/m.24378 type:complete len:324 (-) Transcript_6694:1002-1973(-)